MSLPQTGCYIWYLNSTPTLSSVSASINFVANATEYSSITITSSAIRYGSTSVYSSSAWGNEANRIIVFATEPTGTLLTWLNANAQEFGFSGEAWWWNDNPDGSTSRTLDGTFQTVLDGEVTTWNDDTISVSSSYIKYSAGWFGNKQTLNFPISGVDKLIVFESAIDSSSLLTYLEANATKLASGTTRYYTVTFDANGHGEDPEPSTVVHGGYPTLSTWPTAEGYTCINWYEEASCENCWIFLLHPITSNKTLYAKWSTSSLTDFANTAWRFNNTLDFSMAQLIDFFSNWVVYWPILTYNTPVSSYDSAMAEYHKSEDVYLLDYYSSDNSETTVAYASKNYSTYTAGWQSTEDKFISITDVDVDASSILTTEETVGSFIDFMQANATALTTYTASFNMQGHGTSIAQQTIYEGFRVTEPAIPIETGYIFEGWYTDSTYATEFDFTTGISGNVTLYAKWSAEIYTLTYNLDGGTVATANPSTYTIETATFTLNNPTKTNYIFDGWTDTDSATPTATVTITQGSTGNKVYTANWTLNVCNVSFDMQGHGDQVETQVIEKGTTATTPSPTPTATGYTFGGWYTEAECTNVFDFSTTISTDKTLYAKWTINSYTFSFDMQGHGTQIEPLSVNYGSVATRPTNPTAAGWVFGNWYTDSTFATVYDFTTPVTANTTVYAKWVDDTSVYTVSFNTMGHGTIQSQSVIAGNTATEPTVPTESGYKFIGWYTNIQCTQSFAFTTPIVANITLYAGWALGRVADPQYSQRSTATNYRDTFETNITTAQALVSSTELPLKASVLNNPTGIVGTSSSNAGMQGLHQTNVTNVLNADKNIWFNETTNNEGWVYNLIATSRTTYDATVTYRKNAIVLYNNDGKTYIAKQNIPTGTVPTNSIYWLALELEGPQGNPWWGVAYKGTWDSTLAYSQYDMVKYLDGRVSKFYVAMQDISAGSPLSDWFLAITMQESRIEQAPVEEGFVGTYMSDDGYGNVTFYDANGTVDDPLYVYTLLSNVVIPSSTISYVSSGMMMNNAIATLSSRNNLY